MDKKYIPISCSMYDRLEAWATLREQVAVAVQTDQEVLHFEAVIQDLYARDGVEYIQFDAGAVYRLDQLMTVNGLAISPVC